MIQFYHCMVDAAGTPTSLPKDSPLQELLRLSPNIDQNAQAFFNDLTLTIIEYGVAAIIPIDAPNAPTLQVVRDIGSMRVGRVVAWHPRKVTVEVYDDREVDGSGNPVAGGITKQVTLPKEWVGIVENPFYGIMNEPNGLLQRLLRKLALLDGADEAAGSGKLDLIFQLPFTVRGATRKREAKERRDRLAEQLRDDPLGVAYTDVSEKVVQLNRQVDNKLLGQIEYLTQQLYSELGLTAEIMNNTASREAINGYFDRTIEPIANAIATEMKRKFLTKQSRTLGHSIEIYRDPLKLIPLDQLAEVADKLIRNAVVTSNEFRPKIGFMPSDEPGANKLMNPNMPVQDQVSGEQEEPQ